jgi:hypothetical protein
MPHTHGTERKCSLKTLHRCNSVLLPVLPTPFLPPCSFLRFFLLPLPSSIRRPFLCCSPSGLLGLWQHLTRPVPTRAFSQLPLGQLKLKAPSGLCKHFVQVDSAYYYGVLRASHSPNSVLMLRIIRSTSCLHRLLPPYEHLTSFVSRFYRAALNFLRRSLHRQD